MIRKTLVGAALLATVLFALAACGGNSVPPGTSSAKFNEADVTFATDMIPHHQQAVEMAEMAADRAQSQEVRQLAEDIADAQGPEIQTMTQWLQDWGQQLPSGAMDHSAMGHGSSQEMPGMMDETEMSALAATDGATFDEMFLLMMIDHHRGAIEMARTEQANGQNPDAVALAERIQSDQKAEITTMEQLLGS